MLSWSTRVKRPLPLASHHRRTGKFGFLILRKNLHMREDSFSWTSTSQSTTHSSLQRWLSPPEFTTRTWTRTGRFAWTFWRNNGAQPSPSPRCCWASVLFLLTQIQMILWSQKSLIFTRLILLSTTLMPEIGPKGTLCNRNSLALLNWNLRDFCWF